MKKYSLVALLLPLVLPEQSFAWDPPISMEEAVRRGRPGGRSPHDIHYGDCIKRAYPNNEKRHVPNTRGTSFYWAETSDRYGGDIDQTREE